MSVRILYHDLTYFLTYSLNTATFLPVPGQDQRHMSSFFIVLLRWEVVVRFVDIGGISD